MRIKDKVARDSVTGRVMTRYNLNKLRMSKDELDEYFIDEVREDGF